MNNSQVAHVWAQQQKASARGSNFFFEGPTIYSYGGHWPLASIVTNAHGAKCALVNSCKRSVTTSRHLSYVRRALYGRADVGARVWDVVRVSDRLGASAHADNLRSFFEEAESARKARLKARSKWKLDTLHDAEDRAYIQAGQYTSFFDITRETFDGEESLATFDALVSRDWRALELRTEELRRERVALQAKLDAERNAELQARYRDEFAAWERGDVRVFCPPGYKRDADGSARLRLVRAEDGTETVETSLGAEVPADHARRAFALLVKLRADPLPRSPIAAIHVGHFTIDSVAADGSIRAGCHFITWKHVDSLARKLGLIPAEGSAADDTL